LIRAGLAQDLHGKFTLDLQAGDILSLQTPGGGGWGMGLPAGPKFVMS
jgi:N-methylhydantoinase B/oxoprolinase/acetone carboxylase alpha subunit